MKMRTRKVQAVLAVMALVGVACGGESGEPSASEPQPEVTVTVEATGIDDDCQNLTQGLSVEMVAADNAFAPDCAIIKADAVLSVRNVGVRRHSFTISEGELGDKPYLLNLGPIFKGDTSTTGRPIQDIVEPGKYEFYCKFHAGMDGLLEIVAPFES